MKGKYMVLNTVAIIMLLLDLIAQRQKNTILMMQLMAVQKPFS